MGVRRLSGVIATECQWCSLVRSCPASKLETPDHIRLAFDDWLTRLRLGSEIEKVQLPGAVAADHKLNSQDLIRFFRLVLKAEDSLSPVNMLPYREKQPQIPTLTPEIGHLLGQLFLGEAVA